ncbi:MAG TPA: hypothetical protein VFW96_05235 [Thermomicrobiales bacterium]|nr:hypothetical protein [Thermomicrobiales bacterium]
MEFARRWWWLLALGLLVGALGTVGYMKYGPRTYTSTALVQVPGPDPGAARSDTVNYVAEASSARVSELASQALAGKASLSPQTLIAMNQSGTIDITQAKGANFVKITVTDPDPARAQLVAGTIATVVVDVVTDRAHTDLETQKKSLEQQISFTQQNLLTAQLNQRQEDLKKQLTDQRTLLLQLQTSYEQELQRQAEADRTASASGQTPSAQLAQTRSQWLQVVNKQITDVQQNIDDLTNQLKQVQDQLAQRPSSSDPLLSAAFAGAYAQQLTSLTASYAALQVKEQAQQQPVVRYGDASPPILVRTSKKTLLMGVLAGLLPAAGLGYLLDLLRQRRGRRWRAAEVGNATKTLQLLTTLEGYGLMESTAAADASEVGRDRKAARGQ